MNEKEKLDNNVDYIINSIRIIEKQISYFENKRFLFFKISKENSRRVNNLESVKRYLLKKLEYELNNNKNYHE